MKIITPVVVIAYNRPTITLRLFCLKVYPLDMRSVMMSDFQLKGQVSGEDSDAISSYCVIPLEFISM